MLTNDYETKVTINKREFLDCIDRATLMVKEGDKRPIILNINDDVMELKISSQIGSMDEMIDIQLEGKNIKKSASTRSCSLMHFVSSTMK